MSTNNTEDSFCGLANQQLAFFMARVGLGVNMLFHGVARIPVLPKFVTKMQNDFAESILPGFLVTLTANVIPFAELVLGIMLVLGIATRYALIGVAIQMMILICGCCLVQQWTPLNSQMFLLAMAAVLTAYLPLNCWALLR